MTTAVDKIVSEALELPPPVRAFVAEKLLIESLSAASDGELSPQWREEIRRRRAEVDQGTVNLRDAESAFTGAFAALA